MAIETEEMTHKTTVAAPSTTKPVDEVSAASHQQRSEKKTPRQPDQAPGLPEIVSGKPEPAELNRFGVTQPTDKLATPESMKQLLVSLLPAGINSLKQMSEEERADQTKKLWFSNPRVAIESVAPAILGMKFAGEYLYEIVRAYAPQIRELKKHTKINSRMRPGAAGRVTWKDIGIVPTASVDYENGKGLQPIKEDDPIGWVSLCAQVFDTGAGYMNNLLEGKYEKVDDNEGANAPDQPPYVPEPEPKPQSTRSSGDTSRKRSGGQSTGSKSGIVQQRISVTYRTAEDLFDAIDADADLSESMTKVFETNDFTKFKASTEAFMNKVIGAFWPVGEGIVQVEVKLKTKRDFIDGSASGTAA